jgi:DegV family protein with EDD domain
MLIVTDSGTDLNLPPEQLTELGIHVVPLAVTLDGKTYREGLDIGVQEFYKLLSESGGLPSTSQPTSGELSELYRRLAKEDPEILSIHISSGLSGTVNGAMVAASMTPEANVTVVDTKTLSTAAGWQVLAAARAARAGLSKEEILALMASVSRASDSIYTLQELKYLIHGGRISHMKGLVASLLNIKPLIGVEKVGGTYEQRGQVRTFKGAIRGLVDLMSRQYEPGSALRTQVMHADNPEGAEMLRQQLDERFECSWLPVAPISLVLGAHTGPSLVAVAYGPQEVFASLP